MTSVALVNASGPTDGITSATETYARTLARLGAEVTWYQCLDHGDVWHRDVSVPVRTVRGVGLPNRTLDMGVNRLWGFRRRLGPLPQDVVLLADPTLAGSAAGRRRTIVRVHDLRPLTPFADRRLTRWMFRRALPKLRGAERLLTASAAVAAELAEHAVDPGRVRVVPEMSLLGSHPEHVDASVRRVTSTATLRVLTVGTDRPYKNLRWVGEVARAAAASGGVGRVRFTVVSRLTDRNRRWFRQLGLDDLELVEAAPSMESLYASHDVLLQPSLYEGFGRPVLEALGFGMPVLATRIRSMEELLGPAGRLLDPTRVEPWQEALSALTNPLELAAAGRQALARAQAFSPERFQERLASAVLGD